MPNKRTRTTQRITARLEPVAEPTQETPRQGTTVRSGAQPGSICPRCGYWIASPSHTCPAR
jgi:hypothetical protein